MPVYIPLPKGRGLDGKIDNRRASHPPNNTWQHNIYLSLKGIHLIGDTLDVDTTVIDIQAKQITLEKAGQQRTLKFNPTPWLK
jgi:hypothetical protein